MPEKAIFHGPSEPPLLDLSIADMLDVQANRYGDHLAVAALHQHARYTYTGLRDRVRATAARLLESDICPGDRIILLAGNCIEFVDVFLAVAAVGAISVLVAPTLAASDVRDAVQSVGSTGPLSAISTTATPFNPERRNFLTDTEPKLLFIAAKIGYRSNADILTWAAGAFDGNVIVIDGDRKSSNNDVSYPESLVTFDQFVQGPTAITRPLKDKGNSNGEFVTLKTVWPNTMPSSPCCFQFTSGTTGPRKASMLSHNNLINNANLVGHRLQLSCADRLCCIPPLSHCFGLVGGLLASLLRGSSMIMPSEIFNPPLTLKAMLHEGCTHVIAVPSMFDALVKQEQKRLRNENEASAADYVLRSGIIAGATPPLHLLRAIKAYFGTEKLLYPFGMTELSAVSICTTLEDSLLEDNSSIGTAMPHTSIKVVDEKGVVCPVDTPGELCVSGYLVHLGYYRNEAQTAEALYTDETGRLWLRTGDIVTADATGRCRVVGRSKDMIKKHGENIAPRDIEDLLLAHDSVKTSAVVGVPSEKYGESIVAFVERHDRGVVEERQIKAFLREQGLPPHKMPDFFVTVGDGPGGTGTIHEFPLNASGKVLKTNLRRRAGASLAIH